ncbi:MAG TPA: endonuclease/exonuclease/phosphatase family protein [Acidimicrobiales bacterium]|nr:endonuclease/exonuclease/phosphatase family protein [Acidimicrobiales bacterium]
MPDLTVATLNLFNNEHGRWADREPLVAGQALALDADVLTFQEVDAGSDQIDRLVAALGGGYRPAVLASPVPGSIKALAILTRLPVVERDDCTGLGRGDVALAVRLDAAGQPVWVATTHLLFAPTRAGSEIRRGQAARLLEWLGDRHPVVLTGDFNATDGGATVRLVKARLRSAHEAVHGHEPERTHPTPLVHAVDTEAAFGVPELPAGGVGIDYVFVSDDVEVADCRLTFTRPSPEEPALYPSDHFGLVARLRV